MNDLYITFAANVKSLNSSNDESIINESNSALLKFGESEGFIDFAMEVLDVQTSAQNLMILLILLRNRIQKGTVHEQVVADILKKLINKLIHDNNCNFLCNCIASILLMYPSEINKLDCVEHTKKSLLFKNIAEEWRRYLIKKHNSQEAIDRVLLPLYEYEINCINSFYRDKTKIEIGFFEMLAYSSQLTSDHSDYLIYMDVVEESLGADPEVNESIIDFFHSLLRTEPLEGCDAHNEVLMRVVTMSLTFALSDKANIDDAGLLLIDVIHHLDDKLAQHANVVLSVVQFVSNNGNDHQISHWVISTLCDGIYKSKITEDISLELLGYVMDILLDFIFDDVHSADINNISSLMPNSINNYFIMKIHNVETNPYSILEASAYCNNLSEEVIAIISSIALSLKPHILHLSFLGKYSKYIEPEKVLPWITIVCALDSYPDKVFSTLSLIIANVPNSAVHIPDSVFAYAVQMTNFDDDVLITAILRFYITFNNVACSSEKQFIAIAIIQIIDNAVAYSYDVKNDDLLIDKCLSTVLEANCDDLKTSILNNLLPVVSKLMKTTSESSLHFSVNLYINCIKLGADKLEALRWGLLNLHDFPSPIIVDFISSLVNVLTADEPLLKNLILFCENISPLENTELFSSVLRLAKNLENCSFRWKIIKPELICLGLRSDNEDIVNLTTKIMSRPRDAHVFEVFLSCLVDGMIKYIPITGMYRAITALQYLAKYYKDKDYAANQIIQNFPDNQYIRGLIYGSFCGFESSQTEESIVISVVNQRECLLS